MGGGDIVLPLKDSTSDLALIYAQVMKYVNHVSVCTGGGHERR